MGMDRVLAALPDLELSGRDDADEFAFDLEHPEDPPWLPIDGGGESLSRVSRRDIQVQDQVVAHRVKILIP
jgi:hypothetical protein